MVPRGMGGIGNEEYRIRNIEFGISNSEYRILNGCSSCILRLLRFRPQARPRFELAGTFCSNGSQRSYRYRALSPSTTSQLGRERCSAGRRFLTGDPSFGPGSDGEPEFRPLPETRRQVEMVRGVFQRGESEQDNLVLLGRESSEKRLNALARSGELSQYTHLHFATHGILDDR